MTPLAETVNWSASQRDAVPATFASGAFVPLFDDAATSHAQFLASDLMSADI
jgi:hypothetical protein